MCGNELVSLTSLAVKTSCRIWEALGFFALYCSSRWFCLARLIIWNTAECHHTSSSESSNCHIIRSLYISMLGVITPDIREVQSTVKTTKLNSCFCLLRIIVEYLYTSSGSLVQMYCCHCCLCGPYELTVNKSVANFLNKKWQYISFTQCHIVRNRTTEDRSLIQVMSCCPLLATLVFGKLQITTISWPKKSWEE